MVSVAGAAPLRIASLLVQEGTDPEVGHYEVLQRDDDRTRLALYPVTGRSHQLRIHMRELGHPILGCDMYAHEEALALSDRLLLHATTLAFTHPGTGEWFGGECPPDF